MLRRAVSAVVKDGPSLPLTRASNERGKNKSEETSAFEKVLIAFTVLNVILFVYLSTASKETVLSHKQIVGDQLAQMADAISKQHELMSERLNFLSSDISKKEKELDAATAAEEKLESKHDDKHSKEIEELKKQMEELRAQIKAEKTTMEKVKDDIKEKEHNVEELKKQFCERCTFSHAGLQTTCGARKDYLIMRYGIAVETAIETVVTHDPSCLN